jgi:hypothetical protein
MPPLHYNRNRELGDAVLEIKSGGGPKCISHKQELLFLPHNESRTSRGIIISHATRWQLGWRRRHRESSAQENALYARSLVGWDCPSSATMKKATETRSNTGSTDGPITGQEDDEAQVSTRLRQENIRHNIRKFQFQWRISQSPPLPGRIDPPDRVRKIDIVLQQAFNWTQGSFSASWNAQIQNHPYIFDYDRRVELLRDSFLIVSDLLERGQTHPAFRILNEILDTIPRYLVNAHPSLFLCLVELCLGMNMPQAQATLQNKVRAHVAEVAQVVLGPNHPISILLALPLPSGDPLYICGLVIKCLRDAMVNIFGENGYQTRFYEIAAAQNFAQTSQIREAELIFTKLINGISLQFGSEAAFTVYMEFERDKLYQQSPSSSLSQFPPSSIKNDPDPAFLKVERAFDAYNLSLALQMQRQSPEAAPLEIPTWRIDLARYLFHRRRYALALHLCGIGSFDELSFYSPQVIDSVDFLLADRVADTLRDAFHLQAKPTTLPAEGVS